MRNMFQGAIAFNENLGNWNTSAVTNMSGMFANARVFNRNIGNWNTSSVAQQRFENDPTSALTVSRDSRVQALPKGVRNCMTQKIR